MRYIINSADCSYDTAAHKHSIVLDSRIGNPTTFRIASAVYQAPTLASYPLAVYLASDALGDMIPQKHTVKLKASNHENPDSTVAVLTESHTAGRYRLGRGRRFDLKEHSYVREFDFQWMDGDTAVGVVVSGHNSREIGSLHVLESIGCRKGYVVWRRRSHPVGGGERLDVPVCP